MQDPPLIFLSAGEASGDHYGAALIAELRAVLPGASFTGLGGRAMGEAGQRRVVRAEDVAVMGISEIVRHVPRILLSYRRLVRSMQTQRPDAAVLIDFPDVNFRLAKHLKRMGVPVIWFVSPQLWAWKRGRLRWVQQRVDKMLTIFPFEEPFYRARGVDAEFVGHPLAEAALPAVSREMFAAQHPSLNSGVGMDPARPWVALLPGSRWKEVTGNLPAMLRGAALLGGGYDYLLPVAPTLDVSQVSDFASATVREIPNWPGDALITPVDDARTALFHSRAAVVASGTATVQAAMMGTPFVVVYRVSDLTYRVARQLVRYPDEMPAQLDLHGNLPVAMVNLLAGRRVVPELLQEQFTGERVADELRVLLAETPEREAQIAALAEVRGLLRADPERAAMARVRDAVLHALPGGGR